MHFLGKIATRHYFILPVKLKQPRPNFYGKAMETKFSGYNCCKEQRIKRISKHF